MNDLRSSIACNMRFEAAAKLLGQIKDLVQFANDGEQSRRNLISDYQQLTPRKLVELKNHAEFLLQACVDKAEPEYVAQMFVDALMIRVVYNFKLQKSQYLSDLKALIQRGTIPTKLAVYRAMFELGVSCDFCPSASIVADRIEAEDIYIQHIVADIDQLVGVLSYQGDLIRPAPRAGDAEQSNSSSVVGATLRQKSAKGTINVRSSLKDPWGIRKC